MWIFLARIWAPPSERRKNPSNRKLTHDRRLSTKRERLAQDLIRVIHPRTKAEKKPVNMNAHALEKN